MNEQDKAEQSAFEIFSNLHPHEACQLDSERFIKFVQEKIPGITKEQIIDLINH